MSNHNECKNESQSSRLLVFSWIGILSATMTFGLGLGLSPRLTTSKAISNTNTPFLLAQHNAAPPNLRVSLSGVLNGRLLAAGPLFHRLRNA
jgi:hypothetical protein